MTIAEDSGLTSAKQSSQRNELTTVDVFRTFSSQFE